ncbi:MAG: ArnT family glycosyltransferase [Aggregatilineales bacterium]
MIRKFLILIVSLVLIALYYVWHKPFDIQQLALIGGAALDLLTVSLMIFVSAGVARFLLQRTGFKLETLSLPEKITFESSLGLGLLSLVLLLLALLGFYTTTVMWGILLIVGIVTGRHSWRWLIDFLSICRNALTVKATWTRFIALYALFYMILATLMALSPPHAWDARVYHLEAPRRYLEIGQMLAQPDNHYMGFPQNMELLFGMTMALAGQDTAAALLHGYTGFLALMAVGGFVKRTLNRQAAYTAILLLLSSYSVFLLMGIPYVDLTVMLYSMIMFGCFRAWQENPSDGIRWLILCGIFAGLALGTKYTSGFIIIALCLLIAIHRPRQVIQNGLLFGSAALLLFLPWLLRGWHLYDNPLYPYLFNGLNWDSIRATNFHQSGLGLLNQPDLTWHLPFLPFTATIFGQESTSPYSFDSGIWLFGLMLLLPLVWMRFSDRQRSITKDSLMMMGVLYVIWVYTAATSGIGGQVRLFVAVFPLLAITGAFILDALARLPKKSPDVNFILRITIAASIIILSLNLADVFTKRQILPYFMGQLSRSTQLKITTGFYQGMLEHLSELPADSTVLFLWEPHMYGCPETITCIADPLFDNWSHPIMTGTAPESLLEQWRDDENIDYLLVYGLPEKAGVGYDLFLNYNIHTQATDAQFPELLDTATTEIWRDAFAYSLHTWQSDETIGDEDEHSETTE